MDSTLAYLWETSMKKPVTREDADQIMEAAERLSSLLGAINIDDYPKAVRSRAVFFEYHARCIQHWAKDGCEG